MAITYVTNLVIYTDTDFEQTFILEDDQTNSPLNLTDYNGCAQLKRYETSSKTADFTVTFATDRTTGKITLSLTAATSSTIKPGKYFYDLLLRSPTGVTTRFIEGTAQVIKAVTRY